MFADANKNASDSIANPTDDAYLTAAEGTAMDLEGTELVTLSACESARGGKRTGEGVYGLQRALAVAGARGWNCISSNCSSCSTRPANGHWPLSITAPPP